MAWGKLSCDCPEAGSVATPGAQGDPLPLTMWVERGRKRQQRESRGSWDEDGPGGLGPPRRKEHQEAPRTPCPRCSPCLEHISATASLTPSPHSGLCSNVPSSARCPLTLLRVTVAPRFTPSGTFHVLFLPSTALVTPRHSRREGSIVCLPH